MERATNLKYYQSLWNESLRGEIGQPRFLLIDPFHYTSMLLIYNYREKNSLQEDDINNDKF